MADEQIDLEGESGAKAPERPEWLPENFKSGEELARSYDETRREMDRLRSQSEQDRSQFAEALATMQAEQDQRARSMTDPNSDPRIQAYQRAVDEGDAATQLAISLDLNRQLIQQELQARGDQVTPAIESMQEAQRTQLIDQAEAWGKQYATERGLDYEASKDDVYGALRQLYGDQLMPTQGDATVYNGAMRAAIDITFAQAVIEDKESGELDRRAKLSAMTTVPGASGRLATGSPDETAAWNQVRDAPAGSYAELMGQQQRRG